MIIVAKYHRFLCLLFTLCAGQAVLSAELQGYVFMDRENGAPIPNVQVASHGTSTTATDSNGLFTLTFPQKSPGDLATLTVNKPGLVVLHGILVNQLTLPQDPQAKPVMVIMVKPEERDHLAKEYFRLKGEATVRAEYEAQLKQLEQQNRDTQAAIEGLAQERDQALAQVDQLADELAAIDPENEGVDYQRALQLFLDNDLDAALEILDEQRLIAEAESAQRRVTDVAREIRLRGQILTLQLRFEDAGRAYQQAVDLVPDDPQAHFDFALFHQSLNHFRRATEGYENALALYRELAQADPDTYRPGIAAALHNLGSSYLSQRRRTEALAAFQKSLDIMRELARANPDAYKLDVAGSLNALGLAFMSQKRSAEALKAFEEAQEIIRRDRIQSTPRALMQFATIRNNLGLWHRFQNPAESLAAIEGALALTQELAEANPDNPDVHRAAIAGSLYNRGLLLVDQNRSGEALADFKDALEIQRELAQANPEAYRPLVAEILVDLGNLHLDQNRPTEALEAYEEAVEIGRELSQANPEAYQPLVWGILMNLGNLYIDQNRPTEAVEAYEEALEIGRELAQADKEAYLPDLVNTLNNLGLLYINQNRPTEPLEAHYEEAVEIGRELALADPDTYLPVLESSLNNLGGLYLLQNRSAKALSTFEELLALYRELAQADKEAYLPDLVNTLNNLGLLYINQNRPTEPEAHYEEAVEIGRELALADPDTYLPVLESSLNNLGNLYLLQNRSAKALSTFEELLALYRELAQADKEAYLPDLVNTLNNLGLLYINQNRPTEPLEAHYEEAVEIGRELALADPDTYLPIVAKAASNLGDLLYLQNRPAKALTAFAKAEAIFATYVYLINDGQYSDDLQELRAKLSTIADELGLTNGR